MSHYAYLSEKIPKTNGMLNKCLTANSNCIVYLWYGYRPSQHDHQHGILLSKRFMSALCTFSLCMACPIAV